MKFTATVLHNSGPGLFSGLREGDQLSEAGSLLVDAADEHAACEDVWVICNVDDAAMLPQRLSDHAADVTRYRARRNRSLSIADVVVLTPASGTGTTFWHVAVCGFTQIPVAELTWTADDGNDPVSAAYRAMQAWADRD